MRKLLL